MNLTNKSLIAKGVCALVFSYYAQKFVRATADFKTMNAKAKDITNKVIWVTGGSSGIGEELVQQLVELGALVVISSRRLEELERVRLLCSDPSRVACVALDLSDTDQISSVTTTVLDTIRANWSKPGIDILVNNAGRSQRGLIEEGLNNIVVERAMMEVNFFGTVALTKEVLSQDMLQRGSGRIVNISSVAGKMATPVSGCYCASKHALQGWSDTLRYELQGETDITVVNICPGPIATPGPSNAIGGTGGDLRNTNRGDKEKMTVSDCCKHIITAITNTHITESWISKQPVLGFVYLSLYVPSLINLIAAPVVQNRIRSYKGNVGMYESSLFTNIKDYLFGKGKEASQKK
eukprot:TRINITY_DN14439_c0_g1_i3.p1 TRINITY_DN14439_c0_g1~~TRINITY_DN14439_c0_g1_i3.p1  ORF type:complete len:364 (+),score=64.73 TRINITY_DN14439_c0_g1_i3:44-1093(+)